MSWFLCLDLAFCCFALSCLFTLIVAGFAVNWFVYLFAGFHGLLVVSLVICFYTCGWMFGFCYGFVWCYNDYDDFVCVVFNSVVFISFFLFVYILFYFISLFCVVYVYLICLFLCLYICLIG